MSIQRIVIALTMLAFAAPVFADGGLSVYMKYAGTGYNTTVELIDDGFPINLINARGKGTFGNSTVAITVEFVYDEGMMEYCPEGYVLPFAVVPGHLWAMAITASDHSQVYALFEDGWICLTGDMLDWEGETSGFFFGGSGRYDCAAGNWVSHYRGTNLESLIGFRSITGDLQGTLYLDCD